MSHHKRRVYPQAQLEYVQPSAMQPPVDPAAAAVGALQAAGLSQQPVGSGVPGPASPQMMGYQPEQAQLYPTDQLAAGMENMHLQNAPSVPNYYQQQLQQGQGYAGQGRAGKPMNQLYAIDLLTELPPPIHDLSLPPPPLVIPHELSVVPSEKNNAPPEYLRCTLNAVPKTNSLLKKSKLPLALIIRPYQHLHDNIDPPPLTEDGIIVRCRRCRGYINPYVKFLENGRRWRCNFCRLANDVPAAMDQSSAGVPQNRYDRNELKHSVVEYLAPPEYALRQPPPSTYSFILDVSQHAYKNGLLATAVRTILETLETIPNHDQRTRISIMCVDNAVHYFYVPPDEAENDDINMMDIADLEEPFLPRAESLLVPLISSRQNIEKLLHKIPLIFGGNIMNKFALGPALKSAYKLMKSIGGKIIVVSATLPNVGVGKLQKRNENGAINTPKESSQLLSCQNSFYKSFTIDCSKAQITVDMFLASEEYMDVASLSSLGRYTGGQTHFYPGFSAAKIADVTKFTKEFSEHLSMDITMETVMRARGSIGIRMDSFYGHFFSRSSDLCAFSTMPRDQAYVFEMTVDESISAEYCFVQVAVLLSLNTGQRRIRVITVAIPTTDSLQEVYASADQLAMTTYFARKAVEKALNSSLDDARNLLTKSVQDILSTYKKDIVVTNVAGGAPLRLCTNLRMFPLLIHSLTKHMAFRSGIIPSDHRAIALNNLESIPLPYLIKNIYATVYVLHDMPDEVGLPGADGKIIMPTPINASASLFERYGLYLIDNGTELFLWLGGDAVPQLVNDAFGITEILTVPIGQQELPVVEGSELNEKIRNIISAIRSHDDVVTYQSLYIVRGAGLNEPVNLAGAREVASLRLWATSALVEDRVLNSESYREFLQNMKSKINK